MWKFFNKAKIIIVSVIIGFIVTYCLTLINKSPLQSFMHISYMRANKIEKILKENEITYKNVQLSDKKGGSDNIIAYNLTDKTNNVYLLLLDNESKSLSAILNSDNELVYGIVDSGMGLGDISEIHKYKPSQENE